MPNVAFARPEEVNGTVTHIVDGDTFDVLASNGTEYRIRMGDINAVEIGQAGYVEAKAALDSCISGRLVYLDVDDLYLWDNKGTGERLVAIAYIDYNSTHFLNVNEAMFVDGFVEKRDYSNEFNPYNWTLYRPKNQVAELPLTLLAAVVATSLLVVTLFFWRKLTKRSHSTG